MKKLFHSEHDVTGSLVYCSEGVMGIVVEKIPAPDGTFARWSNSDLFLVYWYDDTRKTQHGLYTIDVMREQAIRKAAGREDWLVKEPDMS